jgi:hypothetical protein
MMSHRRRTGDSVRRADGVVRGEDLEEHDLGGSRRKLAGAADLKGEILGSWSAGGGVTVTGAPKSLNVRT